MRGSILHHPAGGGQNRLTIYKVKFRNILAAFIAPAQKGFEEPVIEWISPFLSIFDDGCRTLGEPRNFFRKSLVPQLPAETFRHQLSNFASARSVFPFDGDNFDHFYATFPGPEPRAIAGLLSNRSTAPEIVFLKKE